MSLAYKYKCALEKIVKIEETDRCRCGYMYEITINFEGKEKTFYFDLNHRFTIQEGRIKFEKNRSPTKNSEWDYNNSPIEMCVIGIMPNYNGIKEVGEIKKALQAAYTEHENSWKEEKSNLDLNKKELLL